MMRNRDPFWMFARFASECPKCHGKIKKGDSIFYYPLTRSVLCKGENCGAQASRDFQAAKFDEEQMQAQF